ncbi:MAG: type I-E CRISPR-associated protein Cas6/Cse3/CasE, partial [Nitrospirales bacterium]|nr:type I-E CRISPR-associated protein Cas6/Cse3/CasE [Nitrospirales bacterium]
MFLHRIHLDPRCREARRDLADPYQLHATLCRAFSPPDRKCPAGEILWRLEPETSGDGSPRVLVQSRTIPEWDDIGVKGWLAKADPPLDLKTRLNLNSLRSGQHFRFRLRANPCVSRNGKRIGLLKTEEQEQWLARKGERHGFALPYLNGFDLSDSQSKRIDVRISQERTLRGNQHTGNGV